MNGSSITGNIASAGGCRYGGDTSYGGGIYNAGYLNMNGGNVTGNTASGGRGGFTGNGTSYGGGIYSTNSQVTFDGTQVIVKSNKAQNPSSEMSWYQGWGVYFYSGTPTTTGGFDPATQVTDNTHI
jgi:hypothetical protein